MASRPVLMPKLGLTMEEGTVAEWKVAPGDRVKAGDILFVVETDKIENEIEAAQDGVIETLVVQAGEIVSVGELVATLTVVDTVEGIEPYHRSPEPRVLVRDSPGVAQSVSFPVREAPPDDAAISARHRRVVATPHARRLARGAGLDLRSLTGSGPRGRIVANDVSAALKALGTHGALHVGSETVAAPPVLADRGKRPELSPHQRIVARRMSEAKREIPHFYIFAEADVTFLLELRASLNAEPERVKVSVSHFLVTAVARALANTRGFNVVWSDDGRLEFEYVDVGIAVETTKGIVAPVLKDLGSSSVDEVAEAATSLVDRARAGKLMRDDLQGGATTVSNVGMFGATGLLPIINPGQSSILGVGRTQPVFRPDAREQPRLRQVLNLSLSCDHRVIDGALAARFLQQVQSGLEAPVSLLRGPGK